MKLKDAEALARDLMNQHGLDNWEFKFNNSILTAGVTTHNLILSRYEINLSRSFVAVNSEHEVKDCILHEIAHALLVQQGIEDEDHGPIWRSMFASIGGEAEYQSAAAKPGVIQAEKKVDVVALVVAASFARISDKQFSRMDSCPCESCESNMNILRELAQMPEIKLVASLEVLNKG